MNLIALRRPTAALALLLTVSTAFGFGDNRPIRLIVPFPAGSAPDLIARQVSDKLGEQVGHPVVIDNKPGANGLVGAGAAVQAAPDGLTLFMGSAGTHGINSGLFKKLPYDPVKDFVPVIAIGYSANVLVVNSTSPYKTLADLVAAARAKPNMLTMGSNGPGGTPHLSGAILNQMADIQTTHVPFKTTPVLEVMAGRLDYAFESIPNALEFIKAGKVRALAVTSEDRAYLPTVPTIAESGYKGYKVMAWVALFAPANTPKEIINQLNSAANKALKDPAVIARLSDFSTSVIGGTPDDLKERVSFELARWPAIVKQSGASVD